MADTSRQEKIILRFIAKKHAYYRYTTESENQTKSASYNIGSCVVPQMEKTKQSPPPAPEEWGKKDRRKNINQKKSDENEEQ
jgi:hypothetical protein